jgi:hypothetical protein
MSTKITVKSLGLVAGGAAIAAAAILTMSVSHNTGVSTGTVDVAKASLTTGNPAYTAPPAKVSSGGSDSGGSDSGATTSANNH